MQQLIYFELCCFLFYDYKINEKTYIHHLLAAFNKIYENYEFAYESQNYFKTVIV